MKKYILHTGYIVSKEDGGMHFIGARQLADLYGVCLEECITINDDDPFTWLGIDFSKYKHLRPRYDGDYSL